MRKVWWMAVAMTTAALLAACGHSSDPGDDGTGAPAPTVSTPMSPTELPTMTTPTAPPTVPTDLIPRGVLAGRVTAVSSSCLEVTTDDAIAWSLAGDPGVDVAVGDTVTVTIASLEPGEEACGPGEPARIVSLRLVE